MSKFLSFITEETQRDRDMIKGAIQNRNTILFYYEGDKNIARGYRWVEPVAYGKSSKGAELLRAFQIKEVPSKSKHKPMWRLFRVDKISDVSKSLRKFNRPRKGYNPKGDKTMASVEINAKFKGLNESMVSEIRHMELEGDYLDVPENNQSEYNEIINSYNKVGKFNSYDLYSSHLYSDTYDYVLLSNEEKKVKLSVAFEKHDFGIVTSSIWQDQIEKGIMRKFYLEYLLPKYKTVVSDDRMTFRGFQFWNKLSSIGYEFGVFNTERKEMIKKMNFSDLKEYWGQSEDYEKYRFYIRK